MTCPSRLAEMRSIRSISLLRLGWKATATMDGTRPFPSRRMYGDWSNLGPKIWKTMIVGECDLDQSR